MESRMSWVHIADPVERKRAQQRHADQRRAARDADKIRARNAAAYQKNREREIARSLAWHAANKGRVAARSAARRALIAKRAVQWADLELISDIYSLAAIYNAAGILVDVDHQCPLRGRYVSGLHTHENLTVLPRSVNRSKNNRFIPE